MLITADQLVAHAIGDYVLQSDWMANSKTKAWTPAIVHVLAYGLPWLLITTSPAALAAIVGTHLIIDHYRLARHVSWVKNFLAPRSAWPKPWKECQATGYDPDKPAWMSVWLMIIVDQVMHVLCNALAIKYLG